jgi:hypothetical protein
MPDQGKITYPDVRTGYKKAKPKFQGGGSTGKRTKFKGGADTVMTKSIGTPRDKGVNR